MTATHASEITDAMIEDRIAQIVGAQVVWSGRLPSQAMCDSWDQSAKDKAFILTAPLIHEVLERHSFSGDDAHGAKRCLGPHRRLPGGRG